MRIKLIFTRKVCTWARLKLSVFGDRNWPTVQKLLKKSKNLFNPFLYDHCRNSRVLCWYAFEKKLSLNACEYPCSENIV